jgi:hypothetical protein
MSVADARNAPRRFRSDALNVSRFFEAPSIKDNLRAAPRRSDYFSIPGCALSRRI